MKFLIDASADARITAHLRGLGHDATRVGTHYPGTLEDEEVLELARREERVIITDDADGGELVFRHRKSHAGVIYLRLGTTRLLVTLARVDYVLAHHQDDLPSFSLSACMTCVFGRHRQEGGQHEPDEAAVSARRPGALRA